MNEEKFDLIIIGSGLSCRYFLSKLNNRKKVLIINSIHEDVTKFGINHYHGNAFLQHNIRINPYDQKLLFDNSSLNHKEYEFNLETSKEYLFKINSQKHRIKFKKLNLNKINITRLENKNCFIEIDSGKLKNFFVAKLIIFAASYGTEKLISVTNYNNKKIIDSKLLKSKDNYSTFYKISNFTFKSLKLKESNSSVKYSRFIIKNEETNFHYYIKNFTFKKFGDEWKVTFSLSLLKNKYYKLFLKYFLQNPKIIFLIPLRFILPKRRAIYISIESLLPSPTPSQINQVFDYFVENKFILKSEFSSFKSSLSHFTSNSHFHSNFPERLNDSVFVIGSASIIKTYSANPTGFILNRIDSIVKDIEKFLDE